VRRRRPGLGLGPERMRELLVEGNFQPSATVASLAEGDEVAQLEAIDTECLGTEDAPA